MEVTGRGDNGGGFALQPGVQNPNGHGHIERFVAKNGSKMESAPHGGVLVPSGLNMRGTPQIALWGSENVTIENVTTDEDAPLVIGDSDE